MGTKSTADTILGTATTASFAIPEVGPIVAGVIATGKGLFDLFYQDDTNVDPMTRIPDEADLEAALNDVKASVAADIWANEEGIDQAKIKTISNSLFDALRAAGATGKAGQPTPGDTAVWAHEDVVDLFQPVSADPSPLQYIANRIEQKVSNRYDTVSLYALTVSVYLSHCKAAMTFEVNENFKAYQNAAAVHHRAVQDHRQWEITRDGPEPEIPPAMTTPTDGDGAVGSEKRDSHGTIYDYRSHLGAKKGEKISHFAQLARDEIAKRHAYLQGVIDGRVQALAQRDAYVQAACDQVTVVAGDGGYYWQDATDGSRGDVVDLEALADAQADAVRGKHIGPAKAAWTAANPPAPDGLGDDDVAWIKQILADWKDSLDALPDADDTPS